jgi:hypothetical protein
MAIDVSNRVEEFRSTILARHVEAEEASAHGDPRPRMELWSRRDPVTLFGAIGMSEYGWGQLGDNPGHHPRAEEASR